MQRLRLVAAACLVVAGIAVPVPSHAAGTTARQLLGLLTAAAESSGASYSRELFPHWTDADGDCQSTRAEVLIAESQTAPTFSTPARCTVAAGRWYSWYDGATWSFASDVDIDHVVALKEAWDSGAWSWTTARRSRFANDLGVAYALEAVTDDVNQMKSDLDPAQWLPPLPAVRCRYATTWMLVKYRWRLAIDQAERQALATLVAGTCGDRLVALPAQQ